MAQQFQFLDNTTELWMTKFIIGEIFSSGGATLYKNPSDPIVILIFNQYFCQFLLQNYVRYVGFSFYFDFLMSSKERKRMDH